MELTLEDAKTISIALNSHNMRLVAEYDKLANTPDVSELLLEAARKQYNELTKAGSDLHVKLVGEFPELLQQ